MLFTAAYTQYTGTITWDPDKELVAPEELENLLIFNTVQEGTYITTDYLTPATATNFVLSDLTVGTTYNIELNNYVATGQINEENDSQIDLVVTEQIINNEELPESDEEENIPMEIEPEPIDDEIPSMVINKDPSGEEPIDIEPEDEDDSDPSIDEEGGGDDSIDDIIIDIPETLSPDEISFLRTQALEDLLALIDEWKLRGITFLYQGEEIDTSLIETDTSLVPGPNVTIDTEIDPNTSLDGKTVDELQENVQVDITNEVVTGTLKYIEDYISYDEDTELQQGYFIALHVNSDTESFEPIIRATLDKTIDITRDGVVVLRVDKESVEKGNRYLTVSLLQNDNGNEVYWIQIPLLVNVTFEEHQEI